MLFAPSYDNSMTPEEREKSAADGEAEKVFHSVPSPERWAGLGTKAEFIAPGCFEAHRDALLASDPKSGELGGAVRIPAGRSVDEDLAAPHFDAAKITVPTLVIRGDADTNADTRGQPTADRTPWAARSRNMWRSRMAEGIFCSSRT